MEHRLPGYKMEELLPVVETLAEAYTAHESTSITCETAEQLMGAVAYCIREMELCGGSHSILAEGIPAQKAYAIGAAQVQEKARRALAICNEILAEFNCYGNRCLHDTVTAGLPEFFKWYDVRFEPQNTIITLDYPVLKDLSRYTGIDKIYEYVLCIRLEQKFLRAFPEKRVIRILSKYNKRYEEAMDNICEVVFGAVIGHALARKPLAEPDWENEDYRRVQEVFIQEELQKINGRMEDAARGFVQSYCGDCGELAEYLCSAVRGITIRLKHAADNGFLPKLL